MNWVFLISAPSKKVQNQFFRRGSYWNDGFYCKKNQNQFSGREFHWHDRRFGSKKQQNQYRLFIFRRYYIYFFKVHIFWEDHKNLEKTPKFIWLFLSRVQKKLGYFSSFWWPSQIMWTLFCCQFWDEIHDILFVFKKNMHE